MENNTQVRIGVNKYGIFIQAGDPENKETDIEYMDIVREGGMVKSICLSEYKKLKLYDPYPSLKDVEGKDFKQVISDRINYFSNCYHKFEANELHNALNTILRLVPPSNFEAAKSSPIEDKTQAVKETAEQILDKYDIVAPDGGIDCISIIKAMESYANQFK